MLENRIYNFSAGPSMLPEPVLVRAQKEMLNYEGSGMSVMEMSHRSKVYDKIICDCQENLRKVMNIPDNYKVLFLQGGATGMFAAIPLNLAKTGTADYIVTGNFSGGSFKEGKKYLKDARCAGTTEGENFTRIPKQEELTLNPDADYVHICENNTIFGTKWHWLPETGNVPLVADLSSCILSKPIDVSKFGILYAGAQKNMAPAGLVVAIIREDLIGNAMDITPTMLNFQTHADNGSMFNTPPCWTIYIAKLVLEWIKNDIGGLENMKKINEKKASILYNFLDSSNMFKGTVVPEDRSLMNVPFITGSDELDAKFVKEATANDFVNIKGHRSVGGMRASIYNAMPVEGVEKLVAFMKEFEAANS